jgi:hypothetical protein
MHFKCGNGLAREGPVTKTVRRNWYFLQVPDQSSAGFNVQGVNEPAPPGNAVISLPSNGLMDIETEFDHDRTS